MRTLAPSPSPPAYVPHHPPAGVNLYFVRNDILGTPLRHSWSDLVPNYNEEAFRSIHSFCYNTLWQQVPADAPFQSLNLMETLTPVVLSHSDDHLSASIRRFYEVALPMALRIRHGCRADLKTILSASEVAKLWNDTSGPRPEAEQLTANGYLACPNGLHKDGLHSTASHASRSTAQGHKTHEHGR